MKSMKIKSENLTVEVAEPGSKYKGPRFDWTGFITQVVLDAKYKFCTIEKVPKGDESFAGAGLCGEFGIFCPVGYDDAKPGEHFPKIGTGLVQKADNEPYNFFRRYDFLPFKTVVEKPDESTMVFRQAPENCRGYSFEYEKTLSVKKNILEIRSLLKNVGKKRIQTVEYNHNFVNLDGKEVGPGYRLNFNFKPVKNSICKGIGLKDDAIVFPEVPENAFYCRPEGFDRNIPVTAEISCTCGGPKIKLSGDFKTELIALWGMSHVVSPELFINIDLPPGETKSWTRRYEFCA